MFRIRPLLPQNMKRVFHSNLQNLIKKRYLSNKPENNTDSGYKNHPLFITTIFCVGQVIGGAILTGDPVGFICFLTRELFS